MAEIICQPKTDLEITLRITYDEAKALQALATYGVDPFIQSFFKVMGRAYLEPHQKGLRSLLSTVSALGPITDRFEQARDVMSGQRIAVRSKT